MPGILETQDRFLIFKVSTPGFVQRILRSEGSEVSRTKYQMGECKNWGALPLLPILLNWLFQPPLAKIRGSYTRCYCAGGV